MTGIVERITIAAPEGEDAPGRLRIMTSAGEVALLIGWADLIALAETATAALTSARSAGIG